MTAYERGVYGFLLRNYDIHDVMALWLGKWWQGIEASTKGIV